MPGKKKTSKKVASAEAPEKENAIVLDEPDSGPTKCVVTKKSFINNRLHEAGDVINYVGELGSNLEPYSEEAVKKAVESESGEGDENQE